MISLLIVDDENLIRDTLVRYISWRELGVDTVLEAENGTEALKLIQTDAPDIVVADIKMPHMNGIQLAQIVRSQYPDIHFVFLSGHADKEYLKEAIHLHVDGYIEKPLNLEEISNMVQKLVACCHKRAANTNAQVYFYRGHTNPVQLNDAVFTLTQAMLQGLEKVLMSGDKQAALVEIRNLCNQMHMCEGTEPAYLRNAYFQIVMKIQNNALFRRLEDASKQSNVFLREMSRFDTLEKLERELLRITELLFAENELTEANPVQLVNEYIQKNYADECMTVEKIARDLNFNTSYLCTIYKRQTNCTINSALTTFRIKVACELLRTSHLKQYEIAEKIGYSSGKYFTRVFLKETGMSPKDYRRLHYGNADN